MVQELPEDSIETPGMVPLGRATGVSQVALLGKTARTAQDTLGRMAVTIPAELLRRTTATMTQAQEFRWEAGTDRSLPTVDGHGTGGPGAGRTGHRTGSPGAERTGRGTGGPGAGRNGRGTGGPGAGQTGRGTGGPGAGRTGRGTGGPGVGLTGHGTGGPGAGRTGHGTGSPGAGTYWPWDWRPRSGVDMGKLPG